MVLFPRRDSNPVLSLERAQFYPWTTQDNEATTPHGTNDVWAGQFFGPAWTRTRVNGFKVRCTNHLYYKARVSPNYS